MGSIRASAVAVSKRREQCRFTLATSTAWDRGSNLAEVRHGIVVKPAKSFGISSSGREVCTTFRG